MATGYKSLKKTLTIGLFLLERIVNVASENNALFEDGAWTSPISVLVLAELLAPIGVLDVFVLNSLNCYLFFGNPIAVNHSWILR